MYGHTMQIASTQTPQGEKGATTMAHILCPSCFANTVPAVSWEFSQTSVEVPVCSSCNQTKDLVSLRWTTSAMAILELETHTIHHRDGLVEFVA